MNIILQILLDTMLVLQIIVLAHMLYTNHKRYKQDQEFWREIHEKEKQIYNDLKFTVDCIAEAEEEARNEQGEKDKSL